MIHWAFLILAFFAGAAACYGVLRWLASVLKAIVKSVRF